MNDYLPAYGMNAEWTTLEDWNHEATISGMMLGAVRLDSFSPPKFFWDVWRGNSCLACGQSDTLEEAKAAAEQWAEKELNK